MGALLCLCTLKAKPYGSSRLQLAVPPALLDHEGTLPWHRCRSEHDTQAVLAVACYMIYAPISTVVCPTYNAWGLNRGRRGIEQAPIPGVQTCLPSPYISLPYIPETNPRHAQCVTGRYGYLWNSQRIFQRHLTQLKRM